MFGIEGGARVGNVRAGARLGVDELRGAVEE